jgi:hypothetical protein
MLLTTFGFSALCTAIIQKSESAGKGQNQQLNFINDAE